VQEPQRISQLDRRIFLAVAVAALGYFVDIYDLLLFSIVRVSSLKGLGVPEDLLLNKGVMLINTQMAGLLIGGVLWGILGDKRGRLSVLFGSIFLYSLANIANAFVQNVEQYAILRFIAGVGLAGELGAGITLVSEILPKHLRGYGTSFVASVGILGAVFGGLVADFFNWRTAYLIGGGLGLLILILRVGVAESSMFSKVLGTQAARGNFFSLFKSRQVFVKYLSIILIGVPLWYVIGILMTFTPEFGKALGMSVLPTAGKAVLFSYLGLSIGDMASGIMSQRAKSRKKVLLFYILLSMILVGLHFKFSGASVPIYYASCLAMGFGSGYWAIFVTVAAEQFGTNIRATVATTAPNFVRGSVIVMTSLFQVGTGWFGVLGSGVFVGALAFAAALLALSQIDETYHKDLDYLETAT
jgi:predicted MFS family arabinose efflux permease